MKWISWLVIPCLLLAVLLRVYHLGKTPLSLNWDEAALGYNAYSLLHTGKDEYGTTLPLILRSFGNYTPALYTYTAVPTIAIFGLNAFATRLPSALFGSLALVGTYLLVRKLFTPHIALLSTLLMAISPWHLQFSRVAYEANIALTFTIWGLYFFLKGLHQPRWYLVSAICYGLSLNTYHSTRLFVPIFLIGLLVIYRTTLLKQARWLMGAFFIGCIFILPILHSIIFNTSDSITARFKATSIFTNQQGSINNTNQKAPLLNTIFFSPIPETMYQFSRGYVSHFSPRWLFTQGDNDRHHAPSTGLLYIWEFPFILLGLITLVKKATLKPVLLLWLFTVPIPAALTTEVPHAVRTLIWLPLPHILTALGCSTAHQQLLQRSKRYYLLGILTFVGVVSFSTVEYMQLYHRHLNLESSRFWQFGYEHAVNFITQHQHEYDTIYVSHTLEQPYIFFLFYLQYDPQTYLAEGGTKSYHQQTFSKFVFSDIDWETRKLPGKHLYVLDPAEAKITPIQRVIHTIRYFDNSEAIIFAE